MATRSATTLSAGTAVAGGIAIVQNYRLSLHVFSYVDVHIVPHMRSNHSSRGSFVRAIKINCNK